MVPGSDVMWITQWRCSAMRSLGKLPEKALQLVQATLYLQAAECRAGCEAEVWTGPILHSPR